MALDLSSIKFIGPAFPEPFVKFDLEKVLNQSGLLIKATGEEGRKLQESWDGYRRKIRDLGVNSGPIRVRNYIIEPLLGLLGYSAIADSEKILTREGDEDAGFLIETLDKKSKLRVWTVASGVDLEAPYKRGYAYRFSHVRIAQRVLLAAQERVGILSDGQELRILISDSARPDSQVCISVDPDWKNSREVPDSFRFLLAICSPKGIEVLPDIIDKARLKQATVTKELRIQARQAIEHFIQHILHDPKNKAILDAYTDKAILAKELWHEGLILVYRLLFVLKGEASDDPAKSFGFTGSSIWRRTYSPTVSLSFFVRNLIDEGQETGNLLDGGLRTIFKMFAQGIKSTELNITPLGGALFGENSTPLLSKLHWPEKACAMLLDKLLWTLSERRGGPTSRQRIHYGALDIEDLGRVYEALLELEPGIAQEKMCRLKRSKLEVVVPYSQGEKYRQNTITETEEDSEEEAESEEENNKSTKIQWIEEIHPGQFYLRVGLGRKSTGSYYTPHSFVRFLVQETLGPKIEECSPKDNPYPNKILQIKVLDPAMGSGHFLVEACRFMAEKLYEACRLCDERGLEFENKIDKEQDVQKKIELNEHADVWRNRIIEIPDPQDEILKYLPSSAPGGETSGLSQKKAEALCKRLVAVHCLYGVDKNVLAVELAKLSLWLESQSEGYPLTFLDHRLVVGDSITGPFFEHLLKHPGSQEPLDNLFNKNLMQKLTQTLSRALVEVKELEKSVGIDLSDITNKERAKKRLEETLLPFKILAAAWTGGVMLGAVGEGDFEYGKLARIVSETGKLPDSIDSRTLLNMITKGFGIDEGNLSWQGVLKRIEEGKIIPALPYDLAFPEVFFELIEGGFHKKGFDVVLGNPPWDKVSVFAKEFFAGFDLNILETKTRVERDKIEKKLRANILINKTWTDLQKADSQLEKIVGAIFSFQISLIGSNRGDVDLFRLFSERSIQLIREKSRLGLVLPDGFLINEGASSVRKLFIELNDMLICFTFNNRKKLFDIGQNKTFCLVVVEHSVSENIQIEIVCDVEDETWLFLPTPRPNQLIYTRKIIQKIGGSYLAVPQFKTKVDLEIALKAYDSHKLLGEVLYDKGVIFGREMHKTDDASRLLRMSFDTRTTLINDINFEKGLVPYQNGNFDQYDPLWELPANYVVPWDRIKDRKLWLERCVYYRIIMRNMAGFTNRKMICALIPPGTICLNGQIELEPHRRQNFIILVTIGVLNSFPLDYFLQQKTEGAINKFIFESIPFCIGKDKNIFLAHAALRLSSVGDIYKMLWIEQLGDNWREEDKKPFTWPVLATDEECWEVRSAIDAVVADAYGLNREQYEHILHSFDRASGPNPYTGICLAKFDELKEIGLGAFTKKYDPYWDIPLNENLPKPVIELSLPKTESGQINLFGEVETPRKGRRRKRV